MKENQAGSGDQISQSRHYSGGMAVLSGGHLYCSNECGGNGMPFAFGPKVFYCGQPLSDKTDYTAEAKQAAEPSPTRTAELPCRHPKVGGGNDFMACRDCGYEWDYRKRGQWVYQYEKDVRVVCNCACHYTGNTGVLGGCADCFDWCADKPENSRAESLPPPQEENQ